MDPEYIFSKVIDRIYFGLTTPTSAHQIGNILNLISSLVSPCINTLVFAKHLGALLMQTLPAIDLNDSDKTLNALKFYVNMYSI